MSLLRHKTRPTSAHHPMPRRELEVFPNDPSLADGYMTFEELATQETEADDRGARKSPAALFGSQRVGAVVLPSELQKTIACLIAESDKPMLHVDAKRLFFDETHWDTSYDVRYKSRQQTARHSERDGTAFASVALPAHYSATYAVFDHIKQRLGPEWNVGRVVDWGSGTGSGLWASAHAFQRSTGDTEDPRVADSTMVSYVGIERREGLVNIGRRLLRDLELGDLNVSWQKSFREENNYDRLDGKDVLALSAFSLSSHSTPLARKAAVKEIWDSGADIIVLIDHNTTAGFECIAEARDYLLRLGKQEVEDPATQEFPVKGCHVVAPCPHDGECPLFHPIASKLVCGFTQRLQRPEFVRKTKHAKLGHEDIGYSYVVIRRGARPPRADTKSGRVGEIGKREYVKIAQQTPMVELTVDGEHSETGAAVGVAAGPSMTAENATDVATAATVDESLEAVLRTEAYHWPRLVFPPLKRSGHIILDGCTAEGKIMRMIIPKSQGKQPFYDARKSSWGDIFPHDSKNKPQERFVQQTSGRVIKGEDIGKQSQNHRKGQQRGGKPDPARLAAEFKERKRHAVRERKRILDGVDYE